MKKIIIIILSLIGMLFFINFTLTEKVHLYGFYQSQITSDGHTIQLSIDTNENSFVEYISNREVDRGTYEFIGDKNYKLISDKQTIDVVLDKKNSFEIIIKKVNGGNPIVLTNIGPVPVTYGTEFDDVDKYKSLIEEEY